MLWQVICDQASVLLTTSSVSFANCAMISASWLRVTYPPTVALAPLLQRRKRDRFAIVMEEAATQPQGEAKKAIICITRPLLTQYRRRVSKHIGTLVWWRICNRGRLKRFDALSGGVFGENSAQSAIELIRTKTPSRGDRKWGLLVLPPAGRRENLPEQLTGPMTVRMRNRRPSSV